VLRRILSLLLTISILGYGLALATEVHQSVGGQDPVLEQPAGAGGQAADFDHCNHGIFHLLGMETTVAFILPSLIDRPTGHYRQRLHSSDPRPARKPPRGL